jgi:SAM-dependent methyltransferase
MQGSTERFSSRVDNYLKYRPHYPKAVITALKERTGLLPRHLVADVGSGTGFSAELFLDNGNFVYGIEPNRAMREAGEKYLTTYKNFRSLDATAESTGLPAASVDYIVAGQAFHWFKPDLAHEEFKRILKPGGWVVLLWNDRQTEATPFLAEYEQLLLEFGTDYTEINHKNVDANRVHEFFRGSEARARLVRAIELQFENNQTFDYAGLEGRLLSSSYVPNVGEPNYEPMLARLRALFGRYEENGKVEMGFATLLYAGKL